MSLQSASCCQARRPTSPPCSIPPFLLTLLRSLRLPITPLFSGWRQGTCDDRGVSTGHGDPLPWLFPLAGGVDTFLPALGLHQSILCALRVHIPAHQELLLSSLTGLWLHRFMEWEKALCECFSHPSTLFFPHPNHPDSTLCLFSSVFLYRHNYTRLCFHKRLTLAPIILIIDIL